MCAYQGEILTPKRSVFLNCGLFRFFSTVFLLVRKIMGQNVFPDKKIIFLYSRAVIDISDIDVLIKKCCDIESIWEK